ncbi:hypothetical protein V1509DRAFT_519971 [Lipomyces kononenkoae]
MTLKSGFSISHVPVTREAGQLLGRIESAAIRIDLVARLLWPISNQSTDSDKDENEDIDPFHSIDMLQDPINTYLWVTDGATGKAVGYVWWQKTKGKTEEEWEATWAKRYRPASCNKELMDATSGGRFWIRAKLMKDSDFYSKIRGSFLSTDPEERKL